MASKPNLPERVEAIVRAWPQWSRAERRGIERVVDDVLRFLRTGEGNTFIRQ